ncbi:hypothetical protein [Embleya sp. MST-111070]|uniref:hypothetical protein n=1 Tax=Embleya sp. MST-111070 TaxID=3398231 RepID=UPI003F7361CC
MDAQRRVTTSFVPPAIEREYLAAVAELGEVAGWVLIDANRHSAALGRPREALRLAQRVLADDALSPRLRALFRLREARAQGELLVTVVAIVAP